MDIYGNYQQTLIIYISRSMDLAFTPPGTHQLQQCLPQTRPPKPIISNSAVIFVGEPTPLCTCPSVGTFNTPSYPTSSYYTGSSRPSKFQA